MAWAKIDEVKAGVTLIADGGFTCLKKGQRCLVHNDEAVAGQHQWPGSGLYVECQDGQHFLDGQLDGGDEYIGLTLA